MLLLVKNGEIPSLSRNCKARSMITITLRGENFMIRDYRYCISILLLFNSAKVVSQEYQLENITVYDHTIDHAAQTLYFDYLDPNAQELNLDISKELSVNANLLLTKTNAFGGVQNLYLRGANADQIQISYDGAVLNDPSHPSRGYNFAELSSFDLASLEIYYGSHASTLGSFANAGAMNLQSRVVDTPTIIQKIGSYDSFGTTILVPIKALHQQWELQQFKSRGMSSYEQGEEHDGVHDLRFKVQGQFSFISKTQLKYFVLGRSRKEDLDFGGGTSPEDNNYTSKEQMILPFFEITKTFDSCQHWNFKAQRTVRKRETNNDQDPVNSNMSYFLSRSTLDIVKVYMEQTCINRLRTIANVEFTNEIMNSLETGDSVSHMPKRSQQIMSVSINNDMSFNSKNSILFGLKFDVWDDQDQVGSYRFGYNRVLNGNILIAPSFSFSRKIPSLYQLYSDYGNSELEREESWQAELLVRKTLVDISVELSPFLTRYNQMIDFDTSTNAYTNVGKNKIYGVELRNKWKVTPSVLANLSVNYLRAYNERNSQQLLLRPKWQLVQALSYAKEKQAYTLQFQYIHQREAVDPINFARLNAPSVFLAHFISAYAFSDNFKVELSVQNIFDKQYNMVPGYSALGISAFSDISYVF